jgi:hypothetical protein
VVVDDVMGCHSKSFLEIRQHLWSMVEKIARRNTSSWNTSADEDVVDADVDVEDNNDAEFVAETNTGVHPLIDCNVVDDIHSIPIAFGSKKRRLEFLPNHRRKNQRRGLCTDQNNILLPTFRHGTDNLIEHNIGYCSDAQKWFRVLGVGPTSTWQRETMMIRFMGIEDVVSHETLRNQKQFVFDNGNLSWEQCGYAEAEADLWRSFAWRKPDDVHVKYWDQRFRIFSRFDEGVHLDAESWYSITYEAVATKIAMTTKSIVESQGEKMQVVLDCFSGCGGCTIPFAEQGRFVLAVDIDPIKLQYLK